MRDLLIWRSYRFFLFKIYLSVSVQFIIRNCNLFTACWPRKQYKWKNDNTWTQVCVYMILKFSALAFVLTRFVISTFNTETMVHYIYFKNYLCDYVFIRPHFYTWIKARKCVCHWMCVPYFINTIKFDLILYTQFSK